jgi:hypothetical protein
LWLFYFSLHPWYKNNKRISPDSALTNGRRRNVNQIVVALLKALLVTLVTTGATIAVEKIRRYNKDKDDYYHQPYDDEYERW